MLNISQQTLAAFEIQTSQRFDQTAIQFIQEEFAEICTLYAEEDLHRFVIAGQIRAAELGCSTEQATMLFISLQLLISPDFDHSTDYPHFENIMRRTEIPILTRLENIFEHVSPSIDSCQNGKIT